MDKTLNEPDNTLNIPESDVRRLPSLLFAQTFHNNLQQNWYIGIRAALYPLHDSKCHLLSPTFFTNAHKIIDSRVYNSVHLTSRATVKRKKVLKMSSPSKKSKK